MSTWRHSTRCLASLVCSADQFLPRQASGSGLSAPYLRRGVCASLSSYSNSKWQGPGGKKVQVSFYFLFYYILHYFTSSGKTPPSPLGSSGPVPSLFSSGFGMDSSSRGGNDVEAPPAAAKPRSVSSSTIDAMRQQLAEDQAVLGGGGSGNYSSSASTPVSGEDHPLKAPTGLPVANSPSTAVRGQKQWKGVASKMKTADAVKGRGLKARIQKVGWGAAGARVQQQPHPLVSHRVRQQRVRQCCGGQG